MKKIGALLLAFLLMFSLASCKNSDVPTGMKLCAGGKEDGYYFYVPEEWSLSNHADIKAAYVSRLDTTSVSFAEVFPAEGLDPAIDASEYFFGKYFDDSLEEFPSDTKVTNDGKDCEFGAKDFEADEAKMYAFNYEYSKHKFGFTQIYLEHEGRFYIMTYSALLEEKTDKKTYFDYYSDRFAEIMKNFRFTTPEGSKKPTEYTEDKDGYLLISDSKLTGYDFFMPNEGFKVLHSGATITVKHEDGSNINMSEAMSTGVSVENYWKNRKLELKPFIDGEITEIKVNEPASIGNSDAGFSYEYTFVYNGETYHVYQVLAIEGPILMQKGYVFTYTAKESVYHEHIEEVMKTINKVNFK